MATIDVHSYENFSMPDGVTARINLKERKHVFEFTDGESSNGGINFVLKHVYNDKDEDTTKYGVAFNLNVCETFNNYSQELTDAKGDTYENRGGTINGYVLSSNVPSMIKSFPEVSRMSEYTGGVNQYFAAKHWLYNGSEFRGYNQNGKLVCICDIFGNCILLNYYNSGTELQKIFYSKNGTNTQLFELTYNSDGKLSQVLDKVRNRTIQYTYSGEYLKTMALPEVTYEFILTDYEDEDTRRIERIKTSNGYFINNYPIRISACSGYSAIPDGSANSGEDENDIVRWSHTYDGVGVGRITDIDGNVQQITYANEGYVSARYLEKNGVVVSAEQYTYNLDTGNSTTSKAKRDCLFKNSLNNFTFVRGEHTETVRNSNGQPTRITTTDIPVSEGVTASSITTYTYNADLQPTKEQTVVAYSNNASYTYVTEYSYLFTSSERSVTKTHYVEEDVNSLGKTAEKVQHIVSSNTDNIITYNTSASYSKKTSRTYNDDGTVKSETDGAGATVEYTYKNGNISQVKYPEGNIINYEYTDGLLSTVTSGYNRNVITRNYGEVTELTAGKLKSILFPGLGMTKDITISLAYDIKRRVSQTKVNGSVIENITYGEETIDGKACKTATLVMGGETFKSAAAKDGSFIKSYYNGGLEYTATFDKEGKVTEERDGITGEVTNYTYNDAGELIAYSVSGNNGTTSVSYAYNAYGQLYQEIFWGGLSRAKTYEYKNDSTRWQTAESNNGFSDVLYGYDKLGRIKTKDVLAYNTNRKITGYEIEYEAGSDRPVNVKYSDGETYSYRYDKNGNITQIAPGKRDITEYVYDSFGRLICEKDYRDMYRYEYTYDNSGNITSVDKYYVYDDENGPIFYNSKTISYSNGRIVNYDGNTKFAYDSIGNPTLYEGNTLKWKGKQLISFGNTEFQYDGKGRRIRKGDIEYKYDIEGRVISQSNGLEFFYDREGVAGFIYGGNYYYYKKDLQGNVNELLDANGNSVVQYYYNACGKCSIEGNTTLGRLNPFRYRSYYYDTETYLYYLQTRYYDPYACRFLNMDSVDYADPTAIGGLNLYTYCNNSPVMGYDPDGTWNWGTFWRALGVLAVAAAVTAISIAVSIATVGTAAPVLLGAGIGFAFGTGMSAATQAAFTGNVDIGKMFLDGFVGAVSGAVAVTGIGVAGSAVLGGVLGGASSIGEDIIDGKSPNPYKFFLSAGLGAVGGLVSGAGADAKTILSKSTYFNAVLKTAVSPKKIAMYTAKQVALNKSISISAIRFSASIVASQWASRGLGKLFGW